MMLASLTIPDEIEMKQMLEKEESHIILLITESLKQAIKGYDTELQQKLILIICFTEC